MRFTVLLALAATFTLAPALTAQEASDTDVRSELRTLVTEADGSADRAALLDVLDREDVQAVAAERGLNVDRVKAGAVALALARGGDDWVLSARVDAGGLPWLAVP